MRLKQFDIDPANVDRDGIAEAQQLVGAGSLTLNGALADAGTAAQFDIGDGNSSGVGGVKVGIYSAADLSGVTFTVTGKNQDGTSLTESVTGPNNATVQTTAFFSQVTDVSADGAVGSDVEVGTVDEIITPTIPVDRVSESGATVAVTLTGVAEYLIEETFNNVQTVSSQSVNWHGAPGLTALNVSGSGVCTPGASAIRLRVNSYTDTAEMNLAVSHPPRG